MPKFVPLHLHSHSSLLDGLSKPNQIADVCSNYGYNACALTDHGVLSSSVSFSKAVKNKNIKPIIGCELYINRNDAKIRDKTNGPRQTDHLVVLSKNLGGWKNLMSAVSRSNDDDVYYYKPRLDFELLKSYTQYGNLISFSGHPGSILANCLYEGYDGYGENSKLVSDPVKTASEIALKYQDLFGKGNFFIEIQLIDRDNFPHSQMIADILREVSKKTGIPCVATADSHYPNQLDAIDQRVLLCSSLRTTFTKVYSALDNGEDVGLAGFFKSNNFHIPSQVEMEALHTDEEIANTELIASMCEEYSLTRKPSLPSFNTPSGQTQDEYLRSMCREGYTNVLVKYGAITSESKKKEYADRVNMELEVISKANLSGYFLIVKDYMDWARSQGMTLGPGRGSAAGCLVSYLIGITKIDPIPNGLLFSRFYNSGRNTADNIEYPDIDCDFPKGGRDRVVDYIRNKYGEDKVCGMATFSQMQGRGAIKEVLRVHGACDAKTMDRIASCLPHENEIADKLQEAKEDSIIRWVLNNDPESISEYCRAEDDGTYSGEYASYFEQAMRLEGTFKSQSEHPSGFVISSDVLSEVCPMVRNKDGDRKIAGMDMNDLASMGQVKFDLLSVVMLNKFMYVNELLSGEFNESTSNI